jgi:dihydroorotase (multifunctional complex type)
MAAAIGGVTTVMDMPNTAPPTANREAFKMKLEIAKSKAVVDFCLEAAVNPSELGELQELERLGAVSYELTTAPPGKIIITQTERIQDALSEISRIGGVAGIFAHDDALITDQMKRWRLQSHADLSTFCKTYPRQAEARGTKRILALLPGVGAHVHFRQISTRNAVEMIKRSKKLCKTITCEVSPHHLLLDSISSRKLGPYGKVIPPLREKEDIHALWLGLTSGVIDTIASDHAPHTREEKESGWKSIWDSPSGFAGLETMLPLMIDASLKHRASLSTIVEALSVKPARIFKLFPKKGLIRVGSDADLVLVDVSSEWKIRSEMLVSKAQNTPFDGHVVRARVKTTIVRGEVVAEDGQITIGKSGFGELVFPCEARLA